MATHPSVLAGETQGRGSLAGSHLWGRTESDTTDATQKQQQQYHLIIPRIYVYNLHFFICIAVSFLSVLLSFWSLTLRNKPVYYNSPYEEASVV